MEENKKGKRFLAIDKIIKTKNGKMKILVILGAIGMLIILFSEIFVGTKQQEAAVDEITSEYKYMSSEELERKIRETVESIEGVGRAKVLITYSGSSTKVYAVQKDEETETVVNGEGEKKEEKKRSSEEYVMVENGSGKKNALKIYESEPEIKGVVVVCTGGGKAGIEAKVVNAVTVALGISSAKVFVAELAK